MHSEEEIIKAGQNKIGFLKRSALKESVITFNVALKHETDGVMYSYDVTFKKSTSDRGHVWKYVKYIRVTI
jgi:hypothetical protein